MQGIRAHSVGLIVTSDSTLAEHLVHELRTLDWIAVSIDCGDIALEMMEVVDFSLVIVDVARRPDWLVCRRLVEAKRCPVAIITGFLADDRRYRRFAFHMGVAAYACRLCVQGRLRDLLRRLERGERGIELVAGAVHGESVAAKSA